MFSFVCGALTATIGFAILYLAFLQPALKALSGLGF